MLKIDYTNLSPNNSGIRTHEVDTITPHCVVGQWDEKKIADSFKSPSRMASCNLGIGTTGKLSLCVTLDQRSWCSSSRENDQRAVTIECASDETHPYKMNAAVITALVQTMYELCLKYKKTKIVLLPTKEQRINYHPRSNEMKITYHRDFANKSCPGDYLVSIMPKIVDKVNENLNPVLYRVQCGAFRNKDNAENLKSDLKKAGCNPVIKYDGSLYKVQVGAYSVFGNAQNVMNHLRNLDFPAVIVK